MGKQKVKKNKPFYCICKISRPKSVATVFLEEIRIRKNIKKDNKKKSKEKDLSDE